jgi:hypothetical protein
MVLTSGCNGPTATKANSSNGSLSVPSPTTSPTPAPSATPIPTSTPTPTPSPNGTKPGVVVDSGNNRVLVYKSEGDFSASNLSVVLGQPNKTTSATNYGGLSARSLNYPGSAMFDGSHLIVADMANNRVLIWNQIPTSDFQSADVVLGQPDMMSSRPNNGGRSASSLYEPWGIYSNGTRLFVADFTNNRILIWNHFPTTNGKAADLVLGQPDMQSGLEHNGGISAKSLRGPSVASDGTHLFVADGRAGRVLIWNTLPTASWAPANVVLGQATMTTATSNNGGLSAKSLSVPWGVSSDGTRLVVGDSGNMRVLIWNSIPTVNAQAANIVLGQTSMSKRIENSGGLSASSLSYPNGVQLIGSSLYVVDSGNDRILEWNNVPTINNRSADAVFGQPDFISSGDNSGGIGAASLADPYEIR